MTVEHRVARSAEPSLRNRYDNCLLACRLCNRARGTDALEKGGKRLLDPTLDAWESHFSLVEDRLRPLVPDGDGAFTHRAYDLDDERKVVRRKLRRLLLSDRLELLREIGGTMVDVLRSAEAIRKRNPEAFFAALREIQRLRTDALRAMADLALFAAIPLDKPDHCRCDSTRHHQLPAEIEAQTMELRFPHENRSSSEEPA